GVERGVRSLGRGDAGLAAAAGAPGSRHPGTDAGLLAGGEAAGVSISSANERRQAEFDVLVDFARPDPCMEAVADCLAARAAMVVGTTGFDDAQLARSDRAAEHIPIVLAPTQSARQNLATYIQATA